MKKLTNIVKKLLRSKSAKTNRHAIPKSATVTPCEKHNISQQAISYNALKVLTTLFEGGYQAYLVGGGVRDLQLGREPKDFDVVTDAKPEQVRKLFRNCRLIGKRFRLAHVFFRHEIIEVATFRLGNEQKKASHSQQGMILRDNVYGKNLDDDLWRRDFTVNALYYNIADASIIDCTNGMDDLDKGIIRIIGDATQRYKEDPVRMLRAVRFASKLGFKIHPDTEAPIAELGNLLTNISNARLFEESLKLLSGGQGIATYSALRHHDLLRYLFPQTEKLLSDPTQHQAVDAIILATLKSTDKRIAEGKPVTPAFLFAALLWFPVKNLTHHYEKQGLRPLPAFEKASRQVIVQQIPTISIPRRITAYMQEIWALQFQLNKRHHKKPLRLIQHNRFRAAYDFLLMRAAAEPEKKELADWWTDFQAASNSQQDKMLDNVPKAGKPKRRRRKRRKTEGNE